MSYLLDDDNSVYYYKAQAELNKREKWWLDVFNEAYSIFDKMRLLLHKPFEAKQLITQYKNEDKDFENTLVDVVLYLVSMYKYDLTLKQEKAIDLLSKIIYQYFSRIKRTSYVDKINDLENVLKEKEEEYLRIIKIKEEDSESEIDKLNNEIDKLKSENDRLKEKDANVMPCSQQAMAFIYLLNLIGINTENTKKSIIARFVHRIIGRSEDNIRKRLEFDYDDVNVKQNLRIVADAFSEILPSTTEQILKDINA